MQKKKTLLYDTLKKCKSSLWIIALFSWMVNLLGFATPLYSSSVFDRVLGGGSISTLVMLSIIVIPTVAILHFTETLRSIIMAKIGDWIEEQLTSDVITNAITMMTLGLKTSSGMALRDLATVKQFMTSHALVSCFDIPFALMYVVFMWYADTAVFMVFTLGLVLIFILGFINERITVKLLQESNERSVHDLNEIELASRNTSALRGMGMTKNVLSGWLISNNQTREMQYKAAFWSFIVQTSVKMTRTITQLSVIGIPAYQIVAEHKILPGGVIFALSIMSAKASAPFDTLIQFWKQFVHAKIAYNRLKSLSEAVPDTTTAISLPSPEGAIAFENVTFAYPGSQVPVVRSATFAVPAGKTVVILGANGSGKTTLIKVAAGVYKSNNGTARLDGADTYQWKREQFGRYVGYLPQESELFSGSIKSNIARMKHNISEQDEELVINAAKIAGVHHMILDMPNGYETILGAGGTGLSGGQKQRIALARALFGNDIKLLILDEPNSNLDAQGEECLIAAIKHAQKRNITVLIISHKPNILEVADLALYIQDGIVALYGETLQVIQKLQGSTSETQQST